MDLVEIDVVSVESAQARVDSWNTALRDNPAPFGLTHPANSFVARTISSRRAYSFNARTVICSLAPSE